MSEKSLKPRIRFKGFTEAWEQREFEDIAVIRRGLTYSPSNIRNTGIRVLRSSNINEEYFVKFEDDVFVDKNCINIPFVNNGDILITSANGSSRLVGKHAIVHDLEHNSAVHGGFMLLASSKNPYFVNASMSSAWYKKFIDLYVAGGNGAIGNLNKNDLDNYELMVPTNDEQIKIGELFKNLDTIITLHQRKFDKLTQIKKSLLEKMFPVDGEKTPKIRFIGYTEAWEQRKLVTESFYIVAGGDVDKNKLKGSGVYPVIANALTNEGIVGYYDSEFRIEAPAVTVTGRGEVGHAVARKCNFTPIVRLLTIKTKHDVDFLSNNINLKGFVIESTGVPQLTVPKLEELELYFPKHANEEQSIGNLFVKIDKLITLHQRKLNLLKNIKSSLLNKMFPA